MSVAALSPTRQFAVPVSLDNQQQSGKASRGGALAALGNGNPAPASSGSSDQVSISSQALGELAKDAEVLGKLTRQSLSSLTPNAATAQITFDNLTYSKSSSVSFSQSGNNASFRSAQQESISGTGRIKTADGREFEFSAELEVSQSLSISQSGSGNLDLADLADQALGGGAQPGNTGIVPRQPSAVDNYVKLNLPKLQDLAAAGEQLLSLLDQLNPGNNETALPPENLGNSNLAAGKPPTSLAASNSQNNQTNQANLLQLLDAQRLSQAPENGLRLAA